MHRALHAAQPCQMLRVLRILHTAGRLGLPAAVPRTVRAELNGQAFIHDARAWARAGLAVRFSYRPKALREKPRPQLLDLELLDHLIFQAAAFSPVSHQPVWRKEQSLLSNLQTSPSPKG